MHLGRYPPCTSGGTRHVPREVPAMYLACFPPWIHRESIGDCPRENTAPYRAISAFISSATAGGRTDGANAVAAKAMHITVAKCFICFAHIIPFRSAHLPRYLPTRRDAASPCAARPLTTSLTRHILPNSETPNSESNHIAVVEIREAQGEVVTKPLCQPSELKEQREFDGDSPYF
jgi:hypothetical protein